MVFWTLAFSYVLLLLKGTSFADLAVYMLGKLSTHDLETSCVVLWIAWNDRNKVVDGQPKKQLVMVHEEVETWLQECQGLYARVFNPEENPR